MTFTLIFKDISEERDIPKENYTIKDLLNDYLIKGLEPEICFTLYDKDYMIIPLKEKVSFQEVGNKEIFFETIDALFNEKLFNGKSLEDEFENIEKIGWI